MNNNNRQSVAIVRWPAIPAEPLNGLELFAPLFPSREKVENINQRQLTRRITAGYLPDTGTISRS